jgi:flagellar basal-body rod protein FlgG
MIGALSTAATGLEAQSANVEAISNDLANVNTDGYKRGRNEFQELMYKTTQEPGAQIGANTQSPVGIQTGLGVKVGAQHKVFEQGPAKMTNQPFDLMIEGNGFLPVSLPNGEVGFTRTGSFKPDAQGRLTLSSGAQLVPQITVPPSALSVVISPTGEVKALLPQNQESVLGQIQLVNFQNPEGLNVIGGGIYKPSSVSGQPLQAIPGEAGLGTVQQGALEGSNVNVATSMVDMIRAQRAYEMSAKAMGVVDQMWNATIQVK